MGDHAGSEMSRLQVRPSALATPALATTPARCSLHGQEIRAAKGAARCDVTWPPPTPRGTAATNRIRASDWSGNKDGP